MFLLMFVIARAFVRRPDVVVAMFVPGSLEQKRARAQAVLMVGGWRWG